MKQKILNPNFWDPNLEPWIFKKIHPTIIWNPKSKILILDQILETLNPLTQNINQILNLT
jgi:hypothetical protein